ncbi:hypothetical protein CCS01_12475 [Rhodopila globiformis]|uniref:Uncharacterized protein n=1 Tax=Rhodopila globiformis TaxID=1071 RepID=A0A2S6NHK3_RHOGL|nr:hypothetical protein CCS01_12475 [Rhodopila globiformis]
MVRLVKTGADGEQQAIDVATINRPDDLIEIANLGLTLAEGKQLLLSAHENGPTFAHGSGPRRCA